MFNQMGSTVRSNLFKETLRLPRHQSMPDKQERKVEILGAFRK